MDMRKYIILLLVTLVFSSCGSLTTIEQHTITSIVDYSEFAKNGIYVTESNTVNFDYVPIGSVVSVTTGALSDFTSAPVDVDKAFKKVCEELKEKKANGLINLRIVTSYNSSLYHMTVSGMAIRLKTPDFMQTSIPSLDSNNSESSCVIGGIKCLVKAKKTNGTLIITSQKLNSEQVIQMLQEFNLLNKATMIYVEKAKHAYAGTTDNGIYMNYDTGMFLKISDLM